MKSSSEMTEFLEKHIRWNVFVQTRQDKTNSQTYKQVKPENTNTDNFSTSVCKHRQNYSFADLFNNLSPSCSNCDRNLQEHYENANDTLLVESVKKDYIIFVVIGIISLIGKGMAIIFEIKTLMPKSKIDAKETKVFHMLVFNLCLADLLMVFYLIAFPTSLRYSTEFGGLSLKLCNVFGVTSVLSMQVSMSILVLIAAYRLYSVLYPYKHIHIKVTIFLVILVWFMWLFVAVIPLFNETIFRHMFTREIRVYSKEDLIEKLVSITDIYQTTLALANASSENNNNALFSKVFEKIDGFETNEVAVQLVRSFNLLNLNISNIYADNYYSPKKACTLIYFLVLKVFLAV